MVRGKGFIRARLAKAADNPIEVPGSAVRLGHRDGHAFPDDLGVIDVGVCGEEVQVEAKEPRHPFRTPKPLQQEFVRSQRRCVMCE